MRLIYTVPARTSVWLGPYADTSAFAIETLSLASSLEQTMKAVGEAFEVVLYSLQILRGKPEFMPAQNPIVPEPKR